MAIIMMEAVTPTIRQGSVDMVYVCAVLCVVCVCVVCVWCVCCVVVLLCVMPNLVPPTTTVEQALSCKSRLEVLAPDDTFLTSLYLHPLMTPSTIKEAKAARV
jgi:dihydroorotase